MKRPGSQRNAGRFGYFLLFVFVSWVMAEDLIQQIGWLMLNRDLWRVWLVGRSSSLCSHRYLPKLGQAVPPMYT